MKHIFLKLTLRYNISKSLCPALYPHYHAWRNHFAMLIYIYATHFLPCMCDGTYHISVDLRFFSSHSFIGFISMNDDTATSPEYSSITYGNENVHCLNGWLTKPRNERKPINYTCLVEAFPFVFDAFVDSHSKYRTRN